MRTKTEDKWVAALAHLAIFLNWIGLIATVAIYAIFRERSEFTGRHIRQALGFQTIVALAFLAFGVLATGVLAGGDLVGNVRGLFDAGAAGATGAIGAAMIASALALALALLGALRSLSGSEYTYPLVGGWIDRFFDRLDGVESSRGIGG